MTKRFGADLMVVPEGASEKAESLLLHGGASYFYFDDSIVNKVAGTDGVACATPQFFLASLATECCDALVQLIAYDPVTDFVVQPWVAEKYSESVKDGQVVVGHQISIRSDGTIKLFEHLYPVAARLSSSASGFDTSVFMTMNTMRRLIGDARKEKYSFLADKYGENAVSAVLVKINPEKNPSLLAWNIQNKNEGVEVLVSKSIFSRISETLSGLLKYLHFFAVAIYGLAIVVSTAVFLGSIHERKKEFALLRIMGATKKKLVHIVLGESSLAASMGAIAGIVLASLAVFPYSASISEGLQLPYLESSFFNVVLSIFTSFFLSAAMGLLSSLYSALRISGAETYFTMREGE
jgi:putative ABC transport system permease protein